MLSRLRDAVFAKRRMTILVKDLDSIVEPSRPAGLSVEDMERGHLDGLSELNRERGRRWVDRRFRKNLARGLHGFVGLRDGEIVGYYWWIDADGADAHPDLAWLGSAVDLQQDDVYGSDFYILPAHRKGGAANEFLFHVETALRERGFERIWGYVDFGNRQARWLYSSRGYLPIRDVESRKLLFLHRTGPVPQVGSEAHG